MRKLSGDGRLSGVASMRGLLAVLLVSSYALFLVTSAVTLPAAAAQCSPDFTLSASASSTITAGANGAASFKVTSECGLYGTVFYHYSITPSNGIGLHQPTYHPVVLSSTHPSAGVGYQVITTPSTPVGTYTITFTVTVQQVTHTVSVTVNVNAYTISASPSTLSAPLGQPVQATITLTGSGGYDGTIYYSISIAPNPPAVGTDSCFNPVPGGPTLTPSSPTATSQWTCTITPAGTYTVTITAMPLNGAPDLSTTITVKVK